MTYTKQFNVSEADTAKQMGSGRLEVLSTPSMIAYMENTAWGALENELDETETTVGIDLAVKHLAPTAVGKEVTITARLVEVTTKIYTFEIQAHVGGTLIGEGTHKRAKVNAEKFMNNL